MTVHQTSHSESLLGPLVYFGAALFVTIVVAILFCRYRVANKKQISYGTVLASAAIANIVVFMAMAFYEEGWGVLTREAWTGGKDQFEAVFVVLGGITAICIVPALGVAVSYQRRSKKSESESEKQTWETVRARGRDRFLLKSVARAQWVLVGGALVEICFWLFTHKLPDPLWQMAVKWLLVATGSGAFSGLVEWNTNEHKYLEAKANKPTR